MGENCPFCNEENLLNLKVFRAIEASATVILNAMPITKGHLLVVSDLHVKSINELNREQRKQFFIAVNEAVRIVKKTFSPEGVNVFFNEGEIAGQTIDHLHVHVVPRYAEDNFIIPGRKDRKKIPLGDEAVASLKKMLSAAM